MKRKERDLPCCACNGTNACCKSCSCVKAGRSCLPHCHAAKHGRCSNLSALPDAPTTTSSQVQPSQGEQNTPSLTSFQSTAASHDGASNQKSSTTCSPPQQLPCGMLLEKGCIQMGCNGVFAASSIP